MNNRYSDKKIFGFPEKAASFRSGHITAPIYVRVKPTNRCNHDCWWCVYAQHNRKTHDLPRDHTQSGMHMGMSLQDEMPPKRLLSLISELAAVGVRAVTFSGGGEPLAHPEIVGAFNRTLKEKMDLSLITNGQALSGSRAEILRQASWVRISMDYATKEQMAISRGVSERAFLTLIENIRMFANRKGPRCDLGVNFVVHRQNCNQLLAAALTLKDCGVDNIRFSPMWCQDFLGYHETIEEEVERIIEEQVMPLQDQSFKVHNGYNIRSATKGIHRNVPRCFYMQVVPSIGADLNVYACHNKAYDPSGLIGSVKDRSFHELWFSDEARARFQSLNPMRDCRHECANHHKVNLMYEMATAKSDNFI